MPPRVFNWYPTVKRIINRNDNPVSFRGVSVVQLVAFWNIDYYHSRSNLGVGMSEGCFIFDFDSLHLEVARPI